MKKPVIMIVEEGQPLRERLTQHLLHNGFEVIEALDRSGALESWQHRNPDLVLVGSVVDDDSDGLNLAQEIRTQSRTIPLILITRQSSEALAIAALKIGINDYFKWPFQCAELLSSIQRNLSVARGAAASSPPSVRETDNDQALVGTSPAMRRIAEYLPKVAAMDSTVLVTGETGTGKECVARAVHRHSSRQSKPLVTINCAALPDNLLESELFGFERGAFTGATSAYEGKFKLAQGGSVFLDEIGGMSSYAQAKVLRVIENREITRLRSKQSTPVDIRLITATNQDLQQLISERKFRKDLYYRINVARIHLPPLRDRKEDIPLLIEHYRTSFNSRLGEEVEEFTEGAFQCLLAYDWPGNVRELKNLVEGLFIEHSSLRITAEDLPETVFRSGHPDGHETLRERESLLSALLSTNWNKSKAAQKLKWSRMTLYRKMAKHNIHHSGTTDGATQRTQDELV